MLNSHFIVMYNSLKKHYFNGDVHMRLHNSGQIYKIVYNVVMFSIQFVYNR